MSALTEIPGRKASPDVFTQAGVSEADTTRMAASRAAQVIETVTRAFALLIEEMGDRDNLPDENKLDRWCQVTYWLTDQLDGEVRNIACAMERKPLA